jgi:hypothetical protein
MVGEGKTGDTIFMSIQFFKHLRCFNVPELDGSVITS